MIKNSPILNIAISFDQNYLNQFYVLLESLFCNNKNQLIDFHLIIKDDISVREIKKIESYINSKNCNFCRYYVDENLIAKFVIKDTWPPSVYYKIFFPILVPSHIEKLLYLDTDTIIINSLSTVFNIELGNYPLAAVYDNYVKNQPLIGIEEDGKYFNSGVLLFNLVSWRQQNISEKAINYLKFEPQNILFVDQCALNAVLIDNWMALESRYNLIYSYIPQDISRQELKKFINNKVIIHFTLQRPWNFLCKNRLRVLYKKYFKISTNTKGSYCVDFSIQKIPYWIKLRIKEIYIDIWILKIFWRSIKKLNLKSVK